MHLPRQEHQIGEADLGFAEAPLELADGEGSRGFCFIDMHRRDAGAEQLIGDCAAAGAFQHPLDQLAARIAPW